MVEVVKVLGEGGGGGGGLGDLLVEASSTGGQGARFALFVLRESLWNASPV